jgi:hypothetical protein
MQGQRCFASFGYPPPLSRCQLSHQQNGFPSRLLATGNARCLFANWLPPISVQTAKITKQRQSRSCLTPAVQLRHVSTHADCTAKGWNAQPSPLHTVPPENFQPDYVCSALLGAKTAIQLLHPGWVVVSDHKTNQAYSTTND